MNRAGAGVGGCSGKSTLALLLDRELLLLLIDDDGAEIIGEWLWRVCPGGGGGGAVTVFIGGWLVSGVNGEVQKRAGEGRLKPKKDFADAFGDGGGIDVAVWIERGVGGLVWVGCLVEVENIAVNTEGGIAFCGSRSVVVGFSSPKRGVSSSGIGTSALVRRRIHRVGQYGLRVQHCVRRRRETMKANAMVRSTVVRMIVRLRFPGDWMLDAIVMLVGILVAVVEEIVGDSEETVVTIGKDDEEVELGTTAEGVARVECNIEAKLDGMDDDSVDVVVINVKASDPKDDDSMDAALEAELNVG